MRKCENSVIIYTYRTFRLHSPLKTPIGSCIKELWDKSLQYIIKQPNLSFTLKIFKFYFLLTTCYKIFDSKTEC